MEDSYSTLAVLEIQIFQIIEAINQMEIPFPDEILNEYASMVASYSKQINASLQSYQELTEREIRLLNKAQIKFAYEFLHIAMEMVESFEKGHPLNPNLFDYMQNLIIKKDDLLVSKYYPEAVREYEYFYNPQIREMLERDLERRISQRYN